MPDNYATTDVQQLIFHAGVSCNTDYGSTSSSSNGTKVARGLRNYWGFSDADFDWRWLNSINWTNRIKSELDNDRPVYYRGQGSAGGHAWVIDGYNAIGRFHCNWGWYGDHNDYYELGDFDPNNIPLNNFEGAIFDVYPVLNMTSIQVSGPSEVTSNQRFDVECLDGCNFNAVQWIMSDHLEVHYGGNNWIAVHAEQSGIGWIQAKVVFDGVTYLSSRKYVTCIL
jgi:hypothetical protein